ncbi:alpha-mannosidase [Dorcoceras hygrometricum]|uniref:Alpha-mannosidase n=1 Tax=Dorcoceras hygrometricum TaxID=472368 RepID=A0A2Z7BQ85_9LAMI|nr:alpha-mannosidase [Dorcoceras hygrometricum]
MGCPGQARTKPRRKISRLNEAGDSPDGGRRQQITRGSRTSPRHARRTAARPAARTLRNQCTKSWQPAGHHARNHARNIGRQARLCAASAQVPCAHMRSVEGAPPCTAASSRFLQFFFCVVQSEIRELDAIQATIVLKDPSHSSDTTVGKAVADPDPVSRRRSGSLKLALGNAPGSDQFHEETGTSRDQNKSDHVEDGERRRPAAALGRADGGVCKRSTCVTLNGSGIQLVVGPQPLRLRNHNFGLAQRIMVKRLATSRHDPLGITDSACKNHLVVYNQDLGLIHSTNGNHLESPKVKVRRLSCRVSMKFRVVRTNQYNQDLGLIHSTNGNHLESSNEGSSIDHQVTIDLHAQNITMFPTNETWYFASQILVSSSGDLILILTAQSTRN